MFAGFVGGPAIRHEELDLQDMVGGSRVAFGWTL